MIQQHSSKKQVTFNRNSILESLQDIGGSVGKSIGNDVVSRIPEDALNSIFGTIPKSGEIRPNETVDFHEDRQDYSQVYRPEIIHRQPVRAEERELGEKINAVRQELAALTSELKSLNTDIQKAVQEMPVDPGVYHLNFFERLKSIIRMIRENIEDSRTWLATWSTCKKKRDYWGMYKKHGTTFGLSNERTLATSAG